jgi:hypothetical protein
MAGAGDIFSQVGRPSAIEQNAPYVRPGTANFGTQLGPMQELQFRQWVADNKVPFNADAPQPDYDMRGFWRALQNHDPRAVSGIDPNDNRLHYPDYWKTPLHPTFSGESRFATEVAPMWNAKDQLVSPGGRILFDDRRK